MTGNRRVLMSRGELRRLVCNTKCSDMTAEEMLMEGSLQLGSSFIRGYTLVEIADSFL